MVTCIIYTTFEYCDFQLAVSMSEKFGKRKNAVYQVRDAIEQNYPEFTTSRSYEECCYSTNLEYDVRFKQKVGNLA